MIQIHFIGRQVHLRAALLTNQTVKTGGMFITGMYGMETSPSQNFGNFIFVIFPNLDFSRFRY